MRKLALVILALASGATAAAQQTTQLRVAGPAGPLDALPVEFHRGYAAVPLRGLDRIGWTLASSVQGEIARMGADSLVLRERTPFFLWGGQLLQLADEPYRMGEELWVPLQLYADFLPAHLPDVYAFHADRLTLDSKRVKLPEIAPVPVRTAAPTPDRLPAGSRPGVAARPPAGSAAAKRVVVIDPGHGGLDSGARGPGGVKEKDMVLQLGLALARELEKRGDYEVHLTRDTDRLVPLWERGERATQIKGERHGIFISLHLNAGSALDAQGFETYFLSEARTEHERRVAALENEAFQVGQSESGVQDRALSGILKELSNLDHQHWSAELADMVQKDLAPVQKGPNRGVKQGPLAVLTNALMPAVLIEVGFISNASEARLLGSSDFQTSAAKAIAKSVDRFFASYPPRRGDGAMKLAVRRWGTTFQNPVFLAAGTCGFGEELREVVDLEALGGIVTKSVTVEPRKGNPAPRVAEVGPSMINSIGLANPGLDKVRSEKLPWIRANLRRAKVFVSVAGRSAKDYWTVIEGLDGEDGFLGFELNLSCPNDMRLERPFALDPDAVAEVTSGAKKRTQRPVLIKLAPNDPDLATTVRRAEGAGADGLTLVNTLPGMALDSGRQRPVLGAGQGGLSGPGLRGMGLLAVATARKATTLPLVGVGGIGAANDALEYLLAGASLVQVGTASFANPRAAERIVRDLERWGASRDPDSIDELVGAGVPRPVQAPAAAVS